MELAKAKITPDGGAEISVLFNPSHYALEQNVSLAEVGVPGLPAPVLQFVRGNGRTLTMDLFFDTYEARHDVRDHTGEIFRLMEIGQKGHPPLCTFAWGNFVFRCVVQRVGGRFTLFLPDGTPVRATLSVTFKEAADIEAQARQTPEATAGHARTHVVRRGDTLASIAAAEYGDAGKWRPIAEANGIENPRLLQPGRRLTLPALA